MCNENNANQDATQTDRVKGDSDRASVVKSEKGSSSSSRSLIGWVKISSILAFLTTYSHFFGFSYLKGQLERMGFYSSDVNLMVNESLHLTSSGVAEGVKLIIAHALNDEALLRNGTLTAVALALTAAFILYEPASKGVARRVVAKVRPNLYWLKWLRRLKAPAIILIAGAAGFALQVIGGLLIVFIFSFLWFGLSLGNHLGRASVESLMNEGVCNHEITLEAIEWSTVKGEIVLSCASITDEGKKVYGRIIHQDAKQIYFLTNDAAYHLDAQGKVLFKNLYKTRARDYEKNDTLTKT